MRLLWEYQDTNRGSIDAPVSSVRSDALLVGESGLYVAVGSRSREGPPTYTNRVLVTIQLWSYDGRAGKHKVLKELVIPDFVGGIVNMLAIGSGEIVLAPNYPGYEAPKRVFLTNWQLDSIATYGLMENFYPPLVWQLAKQPWLIDFNGNVSSAWEIRSDGTRLKQRSWRWMRSDDDAEYLHGLVDDSVIVSTSFSVKSLNRILKERWSVRMEDLNRAVGLSPPRGLKVEHRFFDDSEREARYAFEERYAFEHPATSVGLGDDGLLVATRYAMHLIRASDGARIWSRRYGTELARCGLREMERRVSGRRELAYRDGYYLVPVDSVRGKRSWLLVVEAATGAIRQQIPLPSSGARCYIFGERVYLLCGITMDAPKSKRFIVSYQINATRSSPSRLLAAPMLK